MGGGGSFKASALPNVFSDGGGRGMERRGRPANLSAPSGGRARVRTAGRTSAGTSDLIGLGAEGRGRGARGFDPRPGSLACSGSAAAPDTLGASRALFAAGSTPSGAGWAVRTFSSLTLLPSYRDTVAVSRKTRGPRTCARRRLDDIPVQRSPEPASLAASDRSPCKDRGHPRVPLGSSRCGRQTRAVKVASTLPTMADASIVQSIMTTNA